MASYEKTHGRYLLGEEISCLTFWLLQDEEKEGFLDMENFKELMYAFRFNHLEDEASIKKEF